MNEELLQFMNNEVKEGNKVALITVTETTGSSPASPGQMIAVSESGINKGTIGGGATEYKAILAAREAMKNGERIFSIDYDHGENGMVCGGAMKGFGNVMGNENHLYIFGGGHISQSLAKIAKLTGFQVSVIEDREEFKPYFSDVNYIVCDSANYNEYINFSSSAYVVICTRGHKYDKDALDFAMPQKLKYLGMIGSKKKVIDIYTELSKKYNSDELSHVFAPVGLNVASGIPAEIAVAILAEILLIKNNGTPNHKKM